MDQRQLPAYPLFVNDPYFSVWSPSDALNEADTIFWTGKTRKTYGFVWVDGKAYSFLGKINGVEKLMQNGNSLGVFNTSYYFMHDDFDLTVKFISPLIPTDLDLSSRPACYMAYEFSAKKPLKDVKIVLALHESHCYDKKNDYAVGGSFERDGYETAFFGLNRQHPMSHTFDSVAADWGYTYLAAQNAYFTNATAFDKFLFTGKCEYIFNGNDDDKYIIGYDEITAAESKGKMVVAFDDLCSIFYYGEWLRGYYFRNGKTIFDAIDEAYYGYEETLKKLSVFAADLNERLEPYDDDYSLICFAALRQTMGAHKLVENKKGELLWLSKECHSNGCIATVDVTYPSMPLFLLYNPALVSAMLRPIFEFAKMPVWPYDFPPHDAGTYPYCLGQTYGVKGWTSEQESDKRVGNSFQRNRWNGIVVSHPMIYSYPKGSEIYRYEGQMPIEECGNMLISAYLTLVRGGDEKLVLDNYDLLDKWCSYLEKTGLIPEKQLCTDDFVERLDKNVNLAIKSMVAIKCFALTAAAMGKNKRAEKAQKKLDKYKKEFYGYFEKESSIPLTFDTPGSFSQKYNMAYDVLLGTGIFSEEMREKEIDSCLSRNTKYSIPLDSRSGLTKTDWILHTCALTDDREKQRELYKGVAEFLRTSPDRVPFSDLYDINTGRRNQFQNRTVQGGVFMLLLKDEMLK